MRIFSEVTRSTHKMRLIGVLTSRVSTGLLVFCLIAAIGVRASPSSAAVTSFDGEYIRTATSGIGGCTSFGPRTLTIKSGKIFAEENPQTSFIFEGEIADDGSVFAYGHDKFGNTGFRLAGKITDGVFTGKSSGMNCDFEVSMRKKVAALSGTVITKFDGKFKVLLTPIASCGRSAARTVTVKDGQLQLVVNPKTSLTFAGPMLEDGSVIAIGSNQTGSTGMQLSGRIIDGKFEGQSSGLNCDFKVSTQ